MTSQDPREQISRDRVPSPVGTPDAARTRKLEANVRCLGLYEFDRYYHPLVDVGDVNPVMPDLWYPQKGVR